MRALKYLSLAVVAVSLAACETVPNSPASVEQTYEQAQNHPLRLANYQAAEALVKAGVAPVSTSNQPMAGDSPYIVATLANIDALEQSSTLGRIVSEQIANRLTQVGKQVVELKVRNGIYMKRNEGEFLLTREIKEVAAAHRAQGVIVGTYAESAGFVHISLKLVNPENSLVLSAHDYTLPLDRQVRSMLIRR
jgi:TolB-like protein